jgi:hypothetical protein
VETHKDLIYPRVCGDPLFYFLHTLKFTQTRVLDTSLEKLFFLTNIINLHCVKISTYNKHKNEQLNKKPAIFCFRQVVDKRPRSGQGLYRPLGCKKGLNKKYRGFPHRCTYILRSVHTVPIPEMGTSYLLVVWIIPILFQWKQSQIQSLSRKNPLFCQAGDWRGWQKFDQNIINMYV